MNNDEKITNWIEDNEEELNTMFLEEHQDEWCCEEEGMKLLESMNYLDYCEEQYRIQCSD